MAATPRTALIVVDYQNDFAHHKGSFKVAGGEDILGAINARIAEVRDRAGLVVASLELHGPNNHDFARVKGVNAFDIVHGKQYWPDHCIRGTWGAEPLRGLDLRDGDVRVIKGYEDDQHPLSAFGGAERQGEKVGRTLEQVLREFDPQAIDVVGLATEFCDKATVMDALRLFQGRTVRILRDGVRAANPASQEPALAEMAAAGAVVV